MYLINIIFVGMKSGRKIVIKFFFILTFFLCAGINTFSFNSKNLIKTEISSCACDDEICIDIDCLSEDQICQPFNISSSWEHYRQVPIFRETLKTVSFYFTVWQPPKNS